jgi:hypothetical protein
MSTPELRARYTFYLQEVAIMLKGILACAAAAFLAGCATYDYGYAAGTSYYGYGPGYYGYGYGAPYAYEPYYGYGYGPWYYAPPVVSGGVVISGGGSRPHDHARGYDRGRGYDRSYSRSRSGSVATAPADNRPWSAQRAEGHQPRHDAASVAREAAAGGG